MTITSLPFTRLFVLATIFFFSCGESKNAETDAGAAKTAPAAGDEYFTYSIDGKEFSVMPDDIITSVSPDSVFKVFAGKDQEQSIVLTVPNIFDCPCSVASGEDTGGKIDMGSVSLQNFPKRPIGFNSYYAIDSDKKAPVPDVLKITDLGTPDKGYRFISGTFDVIVLKTATNGDDPANTDHSVKGKFRIRHDMKGSDKF